MTREKFIEIVEYIGNITKHTQFEGHVYVVGGSVRDYVMGLTEIKDVDLVIDLERGGERFAEFVRDNLGLTKTVVTFPTYGTAMFKFYKYPEYDIECVQTRKEWYPDGNSRNPNQIFGTLEDDAFRRDITINALYMKPSGEIIDPTNMGLKDIKDKIIRSPMEIF